MAIPRLILVLNWNLMIKIKNNYFRLFEINLNIGNEKYLCA